MVPGSPHKEGSQCTGCSHTATVTEHSRGSTEGRFLPGGQSELNGHRRAWGQHCLPTGARALNQFSTGLPTPTRGSEAIHLISHLCYQQRPHPHLPWKSAGQQVGPGPARGAGGAEVRLSWRRVFGEGREGSTCHRVSLAPSPLLHLLPSLLQTTRRVGARTLPPLGPHAHHHRPLKKTLATDPNRSIFRAEL